MKKILINNKGLTLVELMISLTMMLVIVATMFALIITTQRTQLTEEKKLDTTQSSRAIEQFLTENLRSAGAIYTLLNTPSMLGETPPFNGIYPLNNTSFPDGIIISAGDPKAITKLTSTFRNGDTTINVDTIDRVDENGATVTAWEKDDIGIVVDTDGYYVFKVTATPAVGSAQLTVRSQPVYYSGLLNTANYNDKCDDLHSSIKGNTIEYQTDRPVFKLRYFYIFLVKQENDGRKILTMTTDCEGVADLINSTPTATRMVPITPNLEDFQIEYFTKDNPSEIWASYSTDEATVYPDPCSDTSMCQNFIDQIINKNISSIRINALFKTEEETNKKRGSGIQYQKPIMGDANSSPTLLPVGRFHYVYMRYEVVPRNFNIIY